jgi:hypothetical protein
LYQRWQRRSVFSLVIVVVARCGPGQRPLLLVGATNYSSSFGRPHDASRQVVVVVFHGVIDVDPSVAAYNKLRTWENRPTAEAHAGLLVRLIAKAFSDQYQKPSDLPELIRTSRWPRLIRKPSKIGRSMLLLLLLLLLHFTFLLFLHHGFLPRFHFPHLVFFLFLSPTV